MTANHRRRTGRKPRMSDAERAARREADAALTEAAAARLADDEAAADMVAFMLGRPRLARLSLRNVALLMEQCEERGTDATDVRTFKGWQAVGRIVGKGERAYKLTVPRRDEDQAKAADDADEPRAQAQEEGKPKRPRFYLKAGWFDVSQTEGIETADADAVAEWSAADPAEGPAELYASLVAQAERAGYAIEETPAQHLGAGAQLDEEAPRTIRVSLPADDEADEGHQALTDLAQILAQESRAEAAPDSTTA